MRSEQMFSSKDTAAFLPLGWHIKAHFDPSTICDASTTTIEVMFLSLTCQGKTAGHILCQVTLFKFNIKTKHIHRIGKICYYISKRVYLVYLSNIFCQGCFIDHCMKIHWFPLGNIKGNSTWKYDIFVLNLF